MDAPVLSIEKNLSKKAELGILFLILAVNALFLSWNPFRAFNFFDMGSFLDASWRVYKGQKPYLDFIYISGPVYLYVNAFFFLIFGFTKLAISANLIVVSSIVIVCTFLIARKFAPPIISLFVSLLSACAFYWPISHPWYDQTAHLFGIIAVTIMVLSNFRDKIWNSISFGILVALSFLSKPNIGAPYGLVIFIMLVLSKNYKSLPAYLLSGLTTMFLVTYVPGSFTEFYDQVFVSYSLAGNTYFQQRRFTNLLSPFFWLRGYYFLIVAVLLWTAHKYVRSFLKEFCIFIGVIFVALISVATGSMLTEANIPLAGVSCALAFLFLYRVKSVCEKQDEKKWKQGILLMSLVSLFLTLQSTVYGFQLRVWTYDKASFGDYRMKAPQFRGWQCNRKLGEDLDGMLDFIKENVKPNESLLVLTDMQILYPLAGLDSYRGVPFNYFDGACPAPGRQLEAVKANILQNPPDWIVTHLGKTSFVTNLVSYMKLTEFLDSEYKRIKSWHNYKILKRQK